MQIYSVTTEGAEPLTASTGETLVQLRGVATAGYSGARIVEWGVSFNGVTPTDPPILCELMFQTTDGTASAASEVPVSAVASIGAAMTTGFHSFTVEPTSGGVIEQGYVHPQGGNWVKEYPPGREPQIINAATSRIGVKITPGTLTTTTSATAFIKFEE